MGAPATTVVYVHGLWMRGMEAALLLRRLRQECGYAIRVLRYGSVREPLGPVLARLGQLIERAQAPRVHLIGHSLGGLIVLRYLQQRGAVPPGRVLLLATPCGGSAAARRLAARRVGRRLLGPAAAAELLAGVGRRWELPRELGIIAGTRPYGLGHLLLPFGEANDGTVALSETELPGASARLCLPVTHSGMLLSARVARAAARFLEQGRFGT